MPAESRLVSVFRVLDRMPLGRSVFAQGYKLAAPYFLTIPAKVESIEPGEARARMRPVPWTRNHLGTVHAIALCNLAELSMGAVAEATVPRTHRWIPRGMTVAYLARAKGTMHATATLAQPVGAPEGAEHPVQVSVRDDDGVEVFTATIRIWVTERPGSRA